LDRRYWWQKSDLHTESKEISESQPIFAVAPSSISSTLSTIVFTYRASLIGFEIKHAKIQAFPSKLCEGLWNAYKNWLYDGCTIKVEGKEFKISKTILTAQSEIFERMFSIDSTEESKTGIVKIQGISAPVMEALIEFLHLGAVEHLDEIVEKLFVAADKYAIHDLKFNVQTPLALRWARKTSSTASFWPSSTTVMNWKSTFWTFFRRAMMESSCHFWRPMTGISFSRITRN